MFLFAFPATKMSMWKKVIDHTLSARPDCQANTALLKVMGGTHLQVHIEVFLYYWHKGILNWFSHIFQGHCSLLSGISDEKDPLCLLHILSFLVSLSLKSRAENWTGKIPRFFFHTIRICCPSENKAVNVWQMRGSFGKHFKTIVAFVKFHSHFYLMYFVTTENNNCISCGNGNACCKTHRRFEQPNEKWFDAITHLSPQVGLCLLQKCQSVFAETVINAPQEA